MLESWVLPIPVPLTFEHSNHSNSPTYELSLLSHQAIRRHEQVYRR